MAAKTPSTGNANFLPKDTLPLHSVGGDGSASGRAGTMKFAQAIPEAYYFDDLDTGDSWTSGIGNIAAVAWLGLNSLDRGTVYVSNRETGIITFSTAGSGESGYIVVFRG